jgi:hypothetical protein
MTKDELDKLAKEMGGDVSLADLASEFGGTMTPETPAAPPTTFLQDFAAATPDNLGAVARGVVGGLASPATMITDPITHILNGILGTNDLPPSEGLQLILTKLGVPEPQTKAQQLLQAATAGMSGSAANLLVGGAVKSLPGVVGKVGEVLTQGAPQQIVGGAVGGAASQAAGDVAEAAGASPAVQTAAQIAGGFVGGVVGAGAGGTQVSRANPGPVSEAQQAGVRLMTSDVRPPQTIIGKTAQQLGEMLGTGGQRKAQQVERVAAVKDVLSQYGAEDLNPALTKVTEDLLATRSAALDKWKDAKQEVIDRLSSADLTPVPVPNATQKIDEAIQYLTRLKTEDSKPAISALQDYKQALQGQDLSNLEALRKKIGVKFMSMRPEGMSNTPTVEESVLEGIYGKKDANGVFVDGLGKDMSDYIASNGGAADVTKWRVANKNLADMSKELGLAALKRVIDKGDITPENVKTLLFSAKPSDVEALYRGLSPTGQASAQAAVLAKALERAGGLDALSPNKFTVAVKKLGDQVGILFKPEDQKALDGLARVLDITQRAEVKPMSAPTSFKTTLMLPVSASALTALYGGGMKGVAGAVASGVAIGGLARLYESPGMRKLLTILPQIKPGTPEEAALFKRIVTLAEVVNKGKSSVEPGPVAQQGVIPPVTHAAIAPLMEPGVARTAKRPDQFGSTNYPGAPGAP